MIDELAKRDKVRVFSSGFSTLMNASTRQGRSMRDLDYNQASMLNNVEYFAWRPALHPFNVRIPFLRGVSRFGFKIYRDAAPSILRRWAEDASTIIVESGISVLFLEDLVRWSPNAKLIYIASDDLETIGCDPFLVESFERSAPALSWACVSSPRLARLLPNDVQKYYVPQGLDRGIVDRIEPSPYESAINAVSVGSMLFDADFFKIAANEFPNIDFHVIGSNRNLSRMPKNVIAHAEKPFASLARYIKHANFGVAAYRYQGWPEYLAESSLKLIQYAAFGKPAVCPQFVAGDKKTRFGYKNGDANSIRAAVDNALRADAFEPEFPQTWREVADRIIAPEAYPETRIAQHAASTPGSLEHRAPASPIA